MTSTMAIEASDLSRTFGDLKAVDGLNLSVERGELFAMLGPNGAGKTTTIRMLCCLLRPTGGTATVMGHDIQQDPMAVKRVIDVSPQETAITERLNAWENMSLMRCWQKETDSMPTYSRYLTSRQTLGVSKSPMWR